MERDLDNIASHLDKYPNFAIDTAARMEYLMLTPPEKVRAFLMKYQTGCSMAPIWICRRTPIPGGVERVAVYYARDWKFLATAGTLSVEGKQIQGLNLPQPVPQKIFPSNAIRWIPGL